MPDLKDKLTEKAAGTDVEKRPPTVGELLEVQKNQIALALPKHMTPERFTRVVLTEIKRTPRLKQCTIESLLGAVMLAAQLGLEPGPTQLSYLIPRKNHGTLEAQFQIGYRGMIDLARRTGQVLSIDAHIVYSNDEFAFAYGLDPELRHVPARTDRGERQWGYAVARFRDGGSSFVVLSVDDIEARRERSSTPKDGPWVTDWDAMGRKTCVRALSPFLPQSAELAYAERFDGAVVTDYTTNLLDADPDVLDVDEVDDQDSGEPSPGADTVSGPAGDDGEVAASPDIASDASTIVTDVTARVAEYRATKKAGSAAANRLLDEFLNDRELPMDLEGLDEARAVDIAAWLDGHAIGAK